MTATDREVRQAAPGAGDLLAYASAFVGTVHAVALPGGADRQLASNVKAPGVVTDGRLVVWPEGAAQPQGPTPSGLVGYDTATGTRFAITAAAAGDAYPALAGGVLTWVRGGETDRTLHATALACRLARAPLPDPGGPGVDRRYFPATGHTLAAGFLAFREQNGGLPVLGYPLTEEFRAVNPSDGQEYAVQYVERRRFEYHPELAGTAYEVELGRLGAEEAARRADLIGLWAFAPVSPTADHPPGCTCLAVAQHRLCGEFRPYWEGHGLELGDAGVSFAESVALFGYPISEEFADPRTGIVTRYFERARFEWHPENAEPYRVLLGRLRADCLDQCRP